MTGLCFVDANVIVYSRDPRDPTKRQLATTWLEVLWSQHNGRTSTQVLSESYVVLKRLAAVAGLDRDVWPIVQKYLIWNPQSVDEEVMRRARDVELRYRLSWWDCTMVAAAQLQDCELLLTEDLHDGGVYGSVTARSPFTFGVHQPRATYVASPPANLHRPRGRPRRTAIV